MSLALSPSRVAATLWIPFLAVAAPHAYFSSDDNLQAQVTRSIDAGHTSLKVALFELSSKPLAKSLRQAAERGVRVRLLLNATSTHTALDNTFLPAFEIRYLGGRRGGVMHNKFMVIDQSELITGSFNWTPGAQYVNYENILVEDDAGIVQAYDRQFDRLWARASTKPEKAARKKKTHHGRKSSHS